jgi:hypothetical protein
MKPQLFNSCYKIGFLPLIVILSLCNVTLLAQTVWTSGAGTTDWSTGNNWNTGVTPDAASDVVISATPTMQPVIGASAIALAKTVEIQTGATLTIASTGKLTVNGFKVITPGSTSFYNVGTFENDGQLIVGNISGSGTYGIWNTGTFKNNTGGVIDIDRSTDIGFYNSVGTVTNVARLTIGGVNNVGGTGLYNSAAFNNNTGGVIGIDNSSAIGLFNGGTFTNAATLTVGALASVGQYGIRNAATFDNNTGGGIDIDRSTDIGFYNSGGTVTNVARLTIGGVNNVGGTGLYNGAAFNNNTGGVVEIDRSDSYGVNNYLGTFSNAGTLTVGALASVGQYGIRNAATFDNNTGGGIDIDRSTDIGFYNSGGTVTNAARLTIGGVNNVGGTGLYNGAAFNNNTGGVIEIDRSDSHGLNNYLGTFSNAGTLTVGVNATVGQFGIRNASTFINSLCAKVIVARGNFINSLSCTATSAGFIQITDNLNNAGTFTNNGVLKYGSITGTVTNNQLIVNNIPTPIFTYGGAFSGTIDGIFSDSDAMVSAGDFTAPNDFDASESLSVGAHTFYAKVSLNGSDCSYIVPFTYSVTALPVTLISFSGKKTAENQNTLKWITADEKDFDRFEVQQSGDAKSFEKIGVVLGQGAGDVRSGTLNAYTFTDPMPGEANYYRLKMVDRDGSFDYSRIISVANSAEQAFVGSFYPNPSNGKVFVDVYAVESGSCTLIITDAGGKTMGKQVHHLQKGMNKIGLNSLSPGINLVRFEGAQFSEVRKLIRE